MATLIGWADPDLVPDQWPDAVTLEPAALEALLAAAYEQCVEYAPAPPALAEGETAPPVPARYVLAQILQARALWAMQRTGPGDTFGAEGYAVTIYPLDARIRQLLRPKRRPFAGLR